MKPADTSIYEYIKNYAAEQPDSIVLFDETVSYTANTFFNAVTAIANNLYGQGIRAGDFIAIRAERNVNTLLWLFAVQIMGGVAIMCDPHSDMREMLVKNNISAKKLIEDEPAVKSEAFRGIDFVPLEDSRKTTIVIFTSGSTGGVKAVKLSQYAFINNAVDTSPLGDYRHNDVVAALLPFHHVFAMALVFIALVLRHCVFVPKDVKISYVCECIEKYCVTRLNGVPTLYSAIAEQADKYNLSSLRCGFIGGAPCSAERFKYIEDRLNMTLIPVYGMSECIGISCADSAYSSSVRANGVGRIYSMNSVKITDDGEITVKSPALFNGYIGGDGGVDNEGYLHTGDTGYLDSEGYLHISGRKKDIIIRNGVNISVAEIEKKIASLKFVKEVAVVGLQDRTVGEVPAAVVVPECRNLCNEDRLREEIIKILPKNEVPKKIIFTDALPLLSSGKTDRLRVKKLLTMESLGNE